MPLEKGEKASTPEGFKQNLKTELRHKKPMKQALAIAYSEARRGKKGKK